VLPLAVAKIQRNIHLFASSAQLSKRSWQQASEERHTRTESARVIRDVSMPERTTVLSKHVECAGRGRQWELNTGREKDLRGLESASKLYRTNNHRLSANLVPTFADRGCHVVSVMEPYGRILGFLDRSLYLSFRVALQLYSRG
jgi:CBS-domain-containing membrane protein